jgi:hypothetical protein
MHSKNLFLNKPDREKIQQEALEVLKKFYVRELVRGFPTYFVSRSVLDLLNNKGIVVQFNESSIRLYSQNKTRVVLYSYFNPEKFERIVRYMLR